MSVNAPLRRCICSECRKGLLRVIARPPAGVAMTSAVLPHAEKKSSSYHFSVAAQFLRSSVVDDLFEFFGNKACAADQSAVDLRTAHQLACVLVVHAAAVKNTDIVGRISENLTDS